MSSEPLGTNQIRLSILEDVFGAKPLVGEAPPTSDIWSSIKEELSERVRSKIDEILINRRLGITSELQQEFSGLSSETQGVNLDLGKELDAAIADLDNLESK